MLDTWARAQCCGRENQFLPLTNFQKQSRYIAATRTTTAIRMVLIDLQFAPPPPPQVKIVGSEIRSIQNSGSDGYFYHLILRRGEKEGLNLGINTSFQITLFHLGLTCRLRCLQAQLDSINYLFSCLVDRYLKAFSALNPLPCCQ